MNRWAQFTDAEVQQLAEGLLRETTGSEVDEDPLAFEIRAEMWRRQEALEVPS